MSQRSERRRFVPQVETLEKREVPAMSVGINTSWVAEYNPAWMFTDAFKESRPWTSYAFNTVTGTTAQDQTPIAEDSRGWPTQLAQTVNAQGQLVQQWLGTMMFDNIDGHYPTGTYTAWWDGTGTLNWGGDAHVAAQGLTPDGHHFADLAVTAPTRAGIQMQLTSMSSADPVHNIHVWMPDYNGQSFVGQVWYPGAPFSPYYPLFLQRMAPFHTIRFMHLQQTNESDIVHWSDRKPWDFATQADSATTFHNGMSLEYMTELANELHANMWVNMPHMAQDDFVTNFAAQVNRDLDPSLKVYVEYSDELWNPSPGYAGHQWLTQQLALPQNAGLTFYQLWAQHTEQDFNDWSSVFAGQESRLVRVVAGQAANSWVVSQVLMNMHGHFDAVACDAYITFARPQLSQFDSSTTPDQIIDAMYSDCLPHTLQFLQNHKAIADQYAAQLGRPIQMLAYEGGPIVYDTNQGYDAAMNAAILSPRMYDLYQQLLQGADQIGVDNFMAYIYTDTSPYGYAGLLKYQDQPLSEAYRYDALVDFINGTTTPISVSTPAPASPVPAPASPLPLAPAPIFAGGADAGGLPEVRIYDAATGTLLHDFLAFPAGFRGGVRVAVGDVNGDSVLDIIAAAGPGGGPQVTVFDGRTMAQLFNFYALTPTFTGGVFVAAGDVNGDGCADIICGADAGGGPEVRVFSGRDGALLRDFFALPATFTGGVRMAAGDVNGDGLADIICAAGAGGGPQVGVYDGASGSLLDSFYAMPRSFTGGVYVAAGDMNGDGKADVIAGAGAGGGPQIAVYDGQTRQMLASFYALPSLFTGGVRVGATTDGGGHARLLAAAGPGAGPQLAMFDGLTLAQLEDFYAVEPAFRGGLFTAG